MTSTHGCVSLQLTETTVSPGGSAVDQLWIASIEVNQFVGETTFVASSELVLQFARQLEDLAKGGTPTSKLECGMVAEDARISYFLCQIDRNKDDGPCIAQVSIGAAGPEGLMHRLHVGIKLELMAVATFCRELRDVLVLGNGTATLGNRS